MEPVIVRCPHCLQPNPPGKRFCGDCGARFPVVCLECGAESAPDKRFCADCGALLPGRCTSCGAEVLIAKPFCGDCGGQLSATPPAPAPPPTGQVEVPVAVSPGPRTAPRFAAAASGEERRFVTALFCDLVGFTPLSERLDAEQVREIQTAYFELMSREIERFGGTVEKFAGDAVLALFGVPIAHEDDAERAVRCALSMHAALTPLAADAARRWSVDLGLRVGVNTGEAVGGLVQAGGRQDYAVTGDVVNTAARLQAAAEAGGIMVGAQTMRLAERSVEFGERQYLRLKGKAGAVPAYPVLGLRERQAERWETRPERTPLVGRVREMELLLHAWSRARAGEGQMVMLVADAGVGKSRLVAEAVARIAVTDNVRELRGRCLSHGQNISLWLIADLLRTLFAIREQDGLPHVQSQVTAGVESLLATVDHSTRAAAIDVFGEVLGLPIGASIVANAGAQVRRQVLIKSLRLVLSRVADQTPAVIVLEDLHWIDRASAEVIAEVLTDVPALPMLVLAAHRPGWTAPWSEWNWVERLNLRPLEERDAITLAGAVLGDLALSADLEAYVTDRAGGNPFFIEELLQALQETGGIAQQDGQMRLVPMEANRLPPSLTEILLARLDRLDGQVRSLVQTASVIGRTFAVDLLARVIRREVAALQKPLAVLPQTEIAFPRLGRETEYVFKHATIRDVAYNTLLQRHRQELHAAVARALAALYSSDEYVEVIAYHLSKTEDHREAAVWLERAGDRAADMYANQTALDHYEEARRRLELSGADESALARITEKLGGIFRVIAWYDEALEELELAHHTYQATNDLEGEARTGALIGQVHFLRGAREEAIRSIRAVLERCADQPAGSAPSSGLAALYISLVDPLYNGDRFGEALEAADRATELAHAVGDDRLLAQAQVRRGLALQGTGQLDDARAVLAEALHLAEGTGDLESLAKALTFLGDIALAQGHPHDARVYYQRALKVDENRGDLADTAYLLGRLGRAFSVLGDWAQARSHLERTVELVQSISFAYFSAASLVNLGEHYLLTGEADKASRYLEEPFTIAKRSGQDEQIPYLHLPLAEWDLFEGRPEAALERLEPLARAPRFATPSDHRAMQVAAAAYLETGDEERAEALVRPGLECAIQQGSAIAVLGWQHTQGLLAAQRGSLEKACRILETAISLARSMPYPYGEGRVLYTYGSILLREDDPSQARERLAAALELFRQLGARPYAERVEQALAQVAV